MRIVALCAVYLLLACRFDNISAQSQLQLSPPVDGGVSIPELLVQGTGQGFAGLASLTPTGPIIYYDSVWMEKIGGVGSAGFRFTRAHEYAHHRLGHALQQYSTPPAMLPALSYSSELQADCRAVKVLNAAGDTAALDAGFSIYQSVLPSFDSGNRPGATRRVQNMNACLGRGMSTPATKMGRSCRTQAGTCGPFHNQPALPVGSSCYCATPYGPAGGIVVEP